MGRLPSAHWPGLRHPKISALLEKLEAVLRQLVSGTWQPGSLSSIPSWAAMTGSVAGGNPTRVSTHCLLVPGIGGNSFVHPLDSSASSALEAHFWLWEDCQQRPVGS